jgi:peptidyl-prolyl cis-trans isomerase SDCCAG10
MEAEIRKLQKRRDDSNDEDHSFRKPKKSYLGEELAKYAKIKGVHKKGKKRDEGDILAALSSFRGKLQNTMSVDNEGEGGNRGDERTVGEGEEGMEVDGDIGFLAHELHFPKDNTEETEKAERDYEVIDPRQRGAKAREEERERKRTASKIKGDRSRR